MIPTNRPVIGKDLDAVRQALGLLTADACWLFGLSITRWMQIVRQAPETPVKDPTLALLVRFLGDHPEQSIIPQYPTPAEVYEFVNSIQETEKKQFSVLMGSEASATYRWLNTSSRQSPAVNRLMFYLRQALLSLRPAQRVGLLEQWRATVEKEATARGANDIFKTCQWGPPPTKATPKSKEPTEADAAQTPKRGRKKAVPAEA